MTVVLGTALPFWEPILLFGFVTGLLAGLGAVLAVRISDDAEQPTSGPPHGFQLDIWNVFPTAERSAVTCPAGRPETSPFMRVRANLDT